MHANLVHFVCNSSPSKVVYLPGLEPLQVWEHLPNVLVRRMQQTLLALGVVSLSDVALGVYPTELCHCSETVD